MSKLAVKGGNTGTGVFTFVAPNTNTDRTINIPDAGGQLHTSESVNDHASMPTVAGDPIVESGSNSDGWWTRWADGTQSCYETLSSFSTSSSATFIWTYPVAFTSPAWADMRVPTTSNTQDQDMYTSEYSTGTTSAGFFYQINGTAQTSSTWTKTYERDTTLFAHGRWK